MAAIAIPLIALGSMFIMSKQNKKMDIAPRGSGSEGFTNMTAIANPLPMVNPRLPIPNFPVNTPRDTSVNMYVNPNQTTDKFMDPANFAAHEKNASEYGVGGNVTQTFSLTGKVLEKNEFKHNNMVPFFGAKIRGASNDRNNTESVLDNMQGQGSQQFRKKEQAPLFKPQDAMQYANGAPNMNDFMQSRVNPSLRMANVKPWEEQRVAPGLGLGFTQGGSNGFNSGIEARERWLPKTVDELRVDTNPKISFDLYGHEGPGNAFIKNMPSTQTQGKVEKYLPDKFFASGADRWLTTTGLEKGPTSRSENVLLDVNRTQTTAEYYGARATNTNSSYTTGASEEPKRAVLPVCEPTNSAAQGAHSPTVADYGVLGYQSLPNNRTTTRPDRELGGVSGVVQAIVAPILDLLRPSRKDDVVHNLRGATNLHALVPQGTVFNPADRTKTTIKEMTEGRLDNNHLNVQQQMANAYLVSQQQPTSQQRDTSNVGQMGAAGPSGAYSVSKSYEAEYRQRNNAVKTMASRPNPGGTQMFNPTTNITIDKNDCDRENNHNWGRNGAFSYTTPSKQMHGEVNRSQTYEDARMNCERLNPDILNAFKSNPYTQSLQSWA